MTGCLIQIIDTFPISRNPEIIVGCSGDMSHVVRNKTFRDRIVMPVDGKGIIRIIIGIQPGSLRSYPQDGIFRIVEQMVQFIPRNAVSVLRFVFIISNETCPVELIQTFFRGKP